MPRKGRRPSGTQASQPRSLGRGPLVFGGRGRVAIAFVAAPIRGVLIGPDKWGDDKSKPDPRMGSLRTYGSRRSTAPAPRPAVPASSRCGDAARDRSIPIGLPFVGHRLVVIARNDGTRYAPETMRNSNRSSELRSSYLYGGPADCALAHDQHALPLEMISPPMPAGVEKLGQGIGCWIVSGNIASFVEIAIDASYGEVVRIVRAAVLSRPNMLDVQRR